MNTIEELSKIKGFENMDNMLDEMMGLSDSKFDAIYTTLDEKLEDYFSSDSVQEEIRCNISKIDLNNIEKEKKGIEEICKMIDEDSELSANKKDILKKIFVRSTETIIELAENPRIKVAVGIKKLRDDAIIPTYAHKSDSGADLSAIETIVIEPHETKLVQTGISIEIPIGYEVQVRPRSGMSLKTKLRIANSIGTIDAGYRGEIGVIMDNIGDEPITIGKGTKIAQMVLAEVPMISWDEKISLNDSERGKNGYGSSDTKTES